MNGNVAVYLILIGVVSAEFIYKNLSDPQATITHTLRRYRRQSTQCRRDEIACDSGGCTPEENECDGKTDCEDGSDEANCATFRCPNNLFQCAYGACVRKSVTCDGKKDCKDNSDEATSLCSHITKPQTPVCSNGQWQCASNDCIIEEKMCDGKIDCRDGSDETTKECSGVPCSTRLFFRCDYGACLAKSSKCNGIRDCVDGSDERNCPSIVTPTSKPTLPTPTPTPVTKPTPTRPRPPNTCVIPNHPNNGEYKLGNEKAIPGAYAVAYSALVLNCKARYNPSPPIHFPPLCGQIEDGKWSRDPPTCALACSAPPVSSIRKVSCIYNGTLLDNCDKPVHGTVAKVKCANLYEISDASQNPDVLCRDGSWDFPLPKCTLLCGEKRPQGIPTIVGGGFANKLDYPWHVGVYNLTNHNICGGSIITQQIVLSAAHCFSDSYGKLNPASDYRIVAGKYYGAYDDSRDEEAQESTINKIVVPERYQATINNYEADIAIVVLTKILQPTQAVQPVCVDWTNSYENEQLVEDNVGVVVGWGQTSMGGEPSETLKELQVPFKPYRDCIEKVPQQFKKFITPDKICAGYLSKKQAICQGDSGGGLVFQRNRNRFYIRGIVSTSPSSSETGILTCDANQYAAYTLVSSHLNILRDVEVETRSRIQI